MSHNNSELAEWREKIYAEPEHRPSGEPCPVRCSYYTHSNTVLYNANREPIETIDSLNMIADRHEEWWMLCCERWHWKANPLGNNISGAPPRKRRLASTAATIARPRIRAAVFVGELEVASPTTSTMRFLHTWMAEFR